MKARVTVTLKSGVLDPQGKAIEGALRSLSIDGVKSVRQGKIFDIEIDGEDRDGARRTLERGLRAAARQHDRRELRDRDRLKPMKAAVILFPGSNREQDAARALRQVDRPRARDRLARRPRPAAGDRSRRAPGGFSYGDYLRCGAIAARSPIMRAVEPSRGAGRAGSRHLQRLSDSVRGGSAAGRADAQRRPAIRLQNAASAGRERQRPGSPAATRRARWSSSPSPTAKAISKPTTRRSGRSKATSRWRSAIATRQGRVDERLEPERLGAQHRRRLQRPVQRARPDAAPGKPDRSAGRRRRRPPAVRGSGGLKAEFSTRSH